MNAVEIEEAISQLADEPFDRENFPYAFLEAFGNKETTIKRLRAGASNKSDLGGVLQTNNIHIVTCDTAQVTKMLAALKESISTAKAKAKFILATDGVDFEAEDLGSGETVACAYKDFPDHFGFFLPLAGITTVRQITENAFDIRATSRLNRLYVELLKDNPTWGATERRHDMNNFMARLIFCFFAEDTGILNSGLFTNTVEQMSARDSSNTHEVISTLFRAMNTKGVDRAVAHIPRWADAFPYVNGGLFSGSLEVPRFSKIARSYLIHIGNLDWKRINPDIFGSMIQAVAEDEERGELGMHYTSVPNILKVLNPLFLDDLRAKLLEAGDNARMLLNLRNRMARIRVFDPACGSGNFLVIAYKEMRAIEAEINKRRGESDRRSEIPKTNFRGIELRDFPAEIARLALIIAEYQCDLLYRGHKLALAEFLPLDKQNWITCGNALQLDWLGVCPPTGTNVKLQADDLFSTPLDQAQIDFENEGGETYICGNPPYVWTNDQSPKQKSELRDLFARRTKSWKNLNYISGWFIKLAEHCKLCSSRGAFVSINTVCQGQQATMLWPLIFDIGVRISFAHEPFKWHNLAANNAGVTVVIIGLAPINNVDTVRLYSEGDRGEAVVREAKRIGPYLVPNVDILVAKKTSSVSRLPEMKFGNKPVDGGHLLLNRDDFDALGLDSCAATRLTRSILGSKELINGLVRYCLWIDDDRLQEAMSNEKIAGRIEAVRSTRQASSDSGARSLSARPHQFREMNSATRRTIVVPAVSSEARDYLPVGLVPPDVVITNRCYGIYDGPDWTFALLVSRLHLAWVATVCGRLELRFSYSMGLGWNTFPVPTLTEKNKSDLTRCAEDILLARESHFPATIANLYESDKMPDDLRHAHERNDEVVERIYLGRRFKNDSERLEKLFELYTRMTAGQETAKKGKAEAGA